MDRNISSALNKSDATSCLSLACCRFIGEPTSTTTSSTFATSSHSRSTFCLTIPVAPTIKIFILFSFYYLMECVSILTSERDSQNSNNDKKTPNNNKVRSDLGMFFPAQSFFNLPKNTPKADRTLIMRFSR